MSQNFDPYHKWLGIQPKDQPPNHYRLLALELFESDPDVIDAAYNRQMAYIQQRATGEHMAESQKLLNELAAARLTLLEPQRRVPYDTELKHARAEAAPTKDNAQAKAALKADDWKSEEVAANTEDKARAPDHDRTAGTTIVAQRVTIGTAGRKSEEVAADTDGSGVAPDASESLAFLQTTARLEDRDRSFGAGIAAQRPTKRTVRQRPQSRSRRQLPVVLYAVGGSLAVALCVILYPLLSRENKPGQIASKPENKLVDPKQSEKQPLREEPVRYKMDVSPPSANVVIKNCQGTITGDGVQRQVQIDHLPLAGFIVLEASCNGYESSEQRLTPKPGENGNLRFALKEVPILLAAPANVDVRVEAAPKKPATAAADQSQPKPEPTAVQLPPKQEPNAVDPFVVGLKKLVSLAAPYPPSYAGAPIDKISVQNAVKALAEQAGFTYDFSKSFKNTNPICRQWVRPSIQNKPCDAAIKAILEPVGLTYEVSDRIIVLKPIPGARGKATVTQEPNPKTAKSAKRAAQQKVVSLSAPYPQTYPGAEADKMSVQYAVIEVLKQVGLKYDFNGSRQRTDPVCRQWCRPNIVNQPWPAALDAILEPVGLTYEINGDTVVLKRR